MNTVLITGDSWSRGEWDGYPDNYRITHSGINQYLTDAGYGVVNVGAGGNSNNESLAALEQELIKNKYNHCIFFFTDALRQVTSYDVLNFTPYILIETHTNYITNKLIQLKLEHQVKLTLIGGLGNFAPTIDHNFDYVIDNMKKLLVPSFINYPYANSVEWRDVLLTIDKDNILSADKKEQWSEIIKNSDLVDQQFRLHRNLFWPDGQHPNRIAHQILFDHIIQLWNN